MSVVQRCCFFVMPGGVACTLLVLIEKHLFNEFEEIWWHLFQEVYCTFRGVVLHVIMCCWVVQNEYHGACLDCSLEFRDALTVVCFSLRPQLPGTVRSKSMYTRNGGLTSRDEHIFLNLLEQLLQAHMHSTHYAINQQINNICVYWGRQCRDSSFFGKAR